MSDPTSIDLRSEFVAYYRQLTLRELLVHRFNGSHVNGPHLNGAIEEVIMEKLAEQEALAECDIYDEATHHVEIKDTEK